MVSVFSNSGERNKFFYRLYQSVHCLFPDAECYSCPHRHHAQCIPGGDPQYAIFPSYASPEFDTVCCDISVVNAGLNNPRHNVISTLFPYYYIRVFHPWHTAI
jgi:hypothetical protein